LNAFVKRWANRHCYRYGNPSGKQPLRNCIATSLSPRLGERLDPSQLTGERPLYGSLLLNLALPAGEPEAADWGLVHRRKQDQRLFDSQATESAKRGQVLSLA